MIRVRRVLTILVPFLRKKRSMVERWLILHQANSEIRRWERQLRLKPGKLVRAEFQEETIH